MNKIKEMDPLRREDWASLYGDVPESVELGAKLAFARIRRHEQRKKNIIRIAGIAACLAVCLGVGIFSLRGGDGDAPDRVIAPVADSRVIKTGDMVWASNDDPCFHVHANCPGAGTNAVRLPLITAQEFEKTLCPSCGVNVQLET